MTTDLLSHQNRAPYVATHIAIYLPIQQPNNIQTFEEIVITMMGINMATKTTILYIAVCLSING